MEPYVENVSGGEFIGSTGMSMALTRAVAEGTVRHSTPGGNVVVIQIPPSVREAFRVQWNRPPTDEEFRDMRGIILKIAEGMEAAQAGFQTAEWL